MKIILLLLLLPVQLYSQVFCCDPFKKDTAFRKVALAGQNYTLKYVYGTSTVMMPAVNGPVQPHYSASIFLYDKKGKLLGSTSGQYVPDPGCFEDDPENWVKTILIEKDISERKGKEDTLKIHGGNLTVLVDTAPLIRLSQPIRIQTSKPDTTKVLLLASYYDGEVYGQPFIKPGFMVYQYLGGPTSFLWNDKRPVSGEWVVWNWKPLN